jgi:hypothetical protein
MKTFKQFISANDNLPKGDTKTALVNARRGAMRGDEMEKRKAEVLAKLKEDWKRAALMGAAATAAGAGTAAAIGFPVVAGAVLAGGQYALSSKGLRKDLKRKRFN